MKYRYDGPGPHDDGEGGIVRPLDVREFGSEPGYGPWTALGEPESAPEAPAVTDTTQEM